MRIFYLILAHQAPEQLKRLIDHLTGEGVEFLIHIDAKKEEAPFRAQIHGAHIHWVTKRVNCIWGDFSQVEATLALLALVKEFSPQPQDRVVLRSGQDYPLQSAKKIRTFFEEHPNREFIECFVAKDVHPRPYRNFRGYKVNYSDQRGDYVIFKKHNFTGFYKALRKGRIPKEAITYFWNEKSLADVAVYYKGSQWWALTYGTWQKMEAYYRAHEVTWLTFFTTAFCADEYFFQTLIQHAELPEEVSISPTLTYVEWNRPGVPLPVTFEAEDAPVLAAKRAEGYLFARKFTANASVLDVLDNWK